MATLLGGVDVVVSLIGGATETVKILQLPIRRFPEFARGLADEPFLVELLCGKPAGWSDTLTRESFTAIVEEGTKINMDFFPQWQERQNKAADILNPGAKERLIQEVASRFAPLSQTSQPSVA